MASVGKNDTQVVVTNLLSQLFDTLDRHRLTFLYFAIPRRTNPRRRKHRLETVEDKKLQRIRTTYPHPDFLKGEGSFTSLWEPLSKLMGTSFFCRDEIEHFANRCLTRFGAGKGSRPPTKLTKKGLAPIERGSYPYWEVPRHAVKYLEETRAKILQAYQNIIDVDEQRVFSSLLNDTIVASFDSKKKRHDSTIKVNWEYLTKLDFAMLSVIRARMRAHLGFLEAAPMNGLTLNAALENGLTHNQVKETLESSVPLASTFPELANLIRMSENTAEARLSPVEIAAISERIIVSANQLRFKIEHVVGPQQATEFYNDLRRMTRYSEIENQTNQKKTESLFGLSAVDGLIILTFATTIAKSLAKKLVEWQSNFLLLTKTETAEPKKDTAPAKEPPQLNDTEKFTIEALSTNTMTGEKLAKKAGYPCNSNFRTTLAGLRKRGILGNKAPGYFVKPEYHFLLKSDQGQDKRQD